MAIDLAAPSANQLAQVLDATIAHAHAELARAPMGEELAPFLAALRQSLDRCLEDGNGELLELPPVQSRNLVLTQVRRAFLEQVRGADGPLARDAIAVLDLLDRLERAQSPVEAESSALSLSNDAVSGLSVEVAHDMRSPLTAILFLLDMIRSGRSGPVTTAQSRQLGIAYGAAFGLNQMASDLIDHARGNRRLIEPDPVHFSVTEMLHSVRDILAPVFEERGLRMNLEALPEQARIGFPTALHRVLLNLATNAVKFTPSGSVTVSAQDLHDHRVRFSIADTGRGIPLGVQAQLFRPFRSAPTPGRQGFSSSGLGLSICKELVTALGGELSVTSEEGRGTTFFFDLELPIASSE